MRGVTNFGSKEFLRPCSQQNRRLRVDKGTDGRHSSGVAAIGFLGSFELAPAIEDGTTGDLRTRTPVSSNHR